MNEQFPLGFWNYWKTGELPATEVARWADCGMTLTMAWHFSLEHDDPEALLALLDEARAHEMRLILQIENLSYHDYIADPAAYEARFRAAYERFGKHPATYGFFIGDEPEGVAQFAASRACVGLQKRIAPELKPYLNFHTNMDDVPQEEFGGKPFRAWLAEFAAEEKLPSFSYGHYDQMTDDAGIDSYYRNLRALVGAAEAAGVDVWNTMLSSAHYLFRVPNEYEFAWQVHTAAASGSRGIIWFRMYDKPYALNYHGSPIDAFGKSTLQFERLARVQKLFLMNYGRILFALRRKATYHITNALGGYELFRPGCHPLMDNVWCRQANHGIVSFFEDSAGREYMVLVNGSMDKPGTFHPEFDEKRVRMYEVLGNGASETLTPKPDQYGLWLYPGQMALYRLEAAD